MVRASKNKEANLLKGLKELCLRIAILFNILSGNSALIASSKKVGIREYRRKHPIITAL
jgi:hypothetical protein